MVSGTQLTVDYRCFTFENGCLCQACTGLTTYTEENYAASAERLCRAGRGGLFTKQRVAEKTIIGFAVGNLLSLTAQGVIGHSNNTRLVKQKPPWAPASVWASLQDHQDEQGALIDFRQSKVSPN